EQHILTRAEIQTQQLAVGKGHVLQRRTAEARISQVAALKQAVLEAQSAQVHFAQVALHEVKLLELAAQRQQARHRIASEHVISRKAIGLAQGGGFAAGFHGQMVMRKVNL
nr:hypothetical protein [Tanacetum cinerariifolium]